MKLKSFIALALCAVIPAVCSAKKPKKVETEEAQQAPVEVAEPEAEPTITEECVINVSLFNESVKNKQFADAYEPWWSVYTTCPNANKAIYTQGSKIIKDTSLMYMIGLMDLVGRANLLIHLRLGQGRIECYLVVALIYWALISASELLAAHLERRSNRFLRREAA